MRAIDALDNYLATAREAGNFSWEAGGCLRFVSGWIKTVTGTNPLDSAPGGYRNEDEAWQLVDQMGGLFCIFAQVLGEPVTHATAKRGDIGLWKWHSGHTGMICTGNLWAAQHQNGRVSIIKVSPQFTWSLGLPA